uniref:Thioredoxin domain-containing protein n=1 Tax=Panagrolaimus sp. JU765 TaxID=591449 RepID=A0AC34Q593_9BILA
MKLELLTLLVFLLAVYAEDENPLSHGFGEDIEWVSLDSALELSKEQNKPVFVLIHKTWCGACKALKQNFKTSNKRKEIVELSKKFIMVNLEDEEEPEDEKYAPDGAYIPRLLFLDKNGDPLEVDNKKNYPNNAYYFPQAVDVLKAMKKALTEFGAQGKESEEKVEVEESKKDEKKKEKTEKKEEKEKKKEKAEKKEEKETSKKAKEEKKSEDKKEKSKEKDVKESKKDDKQKKEKAKENKEEKEEKPKKEKAKAEKKEDKEKAKKDKKETKSDSKKQDKEEKKEKEQKKEKKEKTEKTKGKKTEL